MHQTVMLLNKPVQLTVSSMAQQVLAYREQPLLLEMELYFSCLIRKRVRFPENLTCEIQAIVNDSLAIGFRPVMTETCALNSCDSQVPPLTDFPIADPQRFIPDWVRLDYDEIYWIGEFGY